MSEASLLIIQEWERKIFEWERSGKSKAQWCRENNEIYHVFNSWHYRLKESGQKLFIELPESKTSSSEYSGIELAHRDLHIRLSKDFDALTLKRILEVVRRV